MPHVLWYRCATDHKFVLRLHHLYWDQSLLTVDGLTFKTSDTYHSGTGQSSTHWGMKNSAGLAGCWIIEVSLCGEK